MRVEGLRHDSSSAGIKSTHVKFTEGALGCGTPLVPDALALEWHK